MLLVSLLCFCLFSHFKITVKIHRPFQYEAPKILKRKQNKTYSEIPLELQKKLSSLPPNMLCGFIISVLNSPKIPSFYSAKYKDRGQTAKSNI